MFKEGTLLKKIYDLDAAYKPIDEVDELTELEFDVISNLSRLVEEFGLEDVKQILFYLRPNDDRIKWDKEDVLRAIGREQKIQRRIKKKGKKYNTPSRRLFRQWKSRYDRFKEQNYDPKGLKYKYKSLLTIGEQYELEDIRFRERIHYEIFNPDYIVEKAKRALSRTSFWRFRKMIEEYKND
jgi:hypothetical protein